jgi:hypothetical protein
MHRYGCSTPPALLNRLDPGQPTCISGSYCHSGVHLFFTAHRQNNDLPHSHLQRSTGYTSSMLLVSVTPKNELGSHQCKPAYACMPIRCICLLAGLAMHTRSNFPLLRRTVQSTQPPFHLSPRPVPARTTPVPILGVATTCQHGAGYSTTRFRSLGQLCLYAN